MNARVIEGGCLCGAVRYRISGEPRVTSLCHCDSCQRAAGAPSVAWVVVTFHSSPGVVRTFCTCCGTSLTYQRETESQTIDITTASLDQPNAFPPTREIWLSHKLAWERANDTIPQYAESSRGNAPLSRPTIF